jgi:hypothetical protein
MTAERSNQGGLIFYCDHCSDSFDTGEKHWAMGYATVCESGWRARKNDRGTWEHICGSCSHRVPQYTLAAPNFVPAENIPKMISVPVPVAGGPKFDVHRTVHDAVIGALRVGAPGLSEPVRSAIASKVAVDLREQLLLKG